MIAPSAALRRLPVTIICGLHGAGKTTVLQQLLADYSGGALAFIVVQPTTFNFDANLIRGLSGALERKHDIIYEVREDDPKQSWPDRMLECVEQCAASGRYDHLFIELGGGCSVMAAVDALDFLQNVVCVMDALELLEEVKGKTPEGTISASADEAPLIALQKIDLLSPGEHKKCREFLQKLRPDALLVDSYFGEIAPEQILQELVLPEPPQGRELVTASVARIFAARRPFHPERFHTLCFGDWPDVWRVKGFFWIATRMEIVGGFSLTNTSCSSGPGGHWWASVSRDQWPKDKELLARIEASWREPFGDRRQELVLLGEPAALDDIAQQLNACLLTDSEMELGANGWAQLSDPFPSWTQQPETEPD